MLNILKFFPNAVCQLIQNDFIRELEEIRIRVGKPIILKYSSKEIVTNYFPSQEEILKILQLVCDNSIYSYQNQICNGYITIEGGHRVGITGDVVLENEKVKNISHVYSLNFRIAREIEGASCEFISSILDIKKNSVYHTLIVGSPGTGKTTAIRDLAKVISNGSKELHFQGITVGIVDERGEISAMHRGIPQNDLGIRCDILNHVKKSIGIEMLVRSMSPKVIIADEIGNEADITAIKYAISSGVKGIFTAHGETYEDLKRNPILSRILTEKLFDKIIFLDSLGKGKVKEIFIA